MIRSKEDLKFYIEADRISKGIQKRNTSLKKFFFPNKIWSFQLVLRKLEYYNNCNPSLLGRIYMLYLNYRFRKLSLLLNFNIPINTFGPGLSIAHYGTIIVNKGTQVGENCRIHACVNIGTEAGKAQHAPKIGNNCYIGPGVKIYGRIIIGNNNALGANSVINKDFTCENQLIAGIPAKQIKNINIREVLIPATDILTEKVDLNRIIGKTASEINNILKSL